MNRGSFGVSLVQIDFFQRVQTDFLYTLTFLFLRSSKMVNYLRKILLKRQFLYLLIANLISRINGQEQLQEI
jgi:hypothetical protein